MANERVCAVCRAEAHSKHQPHAGSDTNYWMWEFQRLILTESELSAGSQSRRQTQAKTPSENENTTLQGFQHRVDKSNRVSSSPKKKRLTPRHLIAAWHLDVFKLLVFIRSFPPFLRWCLFEFAHLISAQFWRITDSQPPVDTSALGSVTQTCSSVSRPLPPTDGHKTGCRADRG